MCLKTKRKECMQAVDAMLMLVDCEVDEMIYCQVYVGRCICQDSTPLMDVGSEPLPMSCNID